VAKAATAGTQAYFIDLLHERRARPRVDLVMHIVTAHRDLVLTDSERRAGDCMMICVSRFCTARLVLDLLYASL